MKQFLRYQISGMVLTLWIFTFYYSGLSDNFLEFTNYLQENIFLPKIIGGFIFATPFGIIIHQISVMIKNYISVELCKELDDFPKNNKEAFSKNEEYTKYILDRISNLNSYYYVRFDNGFLAPFLALILITGAGYSIGKTAVIVSIIIGVILLSYIPRICREIQKYNELLNENHSESPSNKGV